MFKSNLRWQIYILVNVNLKLVRFFACGALGTVINRSFSLFSCKMAEKKSWLPFNLKLFSVSTLGERNINFFKENWPIPASFSLFSAFLNWNWHIRTDIFEKLCRCWDSNQESLVSEVTALPAVPQPRPKRSINLSAPTRVSERKKEKTSLNDKYLSKLTRGIHSDLLILLFYITCDQY